MAKLKHAAITLAAAAAILCGGFFALNHLGVVAPGPGSAESPLLSSPLDAATGETNTNSEPAAPASEAGADLPSAGPKPSALQSAFGQTAAPGTASAASQQPVLVTTSIRTTAYTHTEADHIKYGKKTALGTDLRYTPEYHSVAADWSRFPLGTKFRMKGVDRLFVVDDYGKALVGSRTVDIYFPSKGQMNHWGVRHVDIDVVEFGNFHESRKILAARANYPHCLEMLASMTRDDWWQNFR